jgi:hypothetical protein
LVVEINGSSATGGTAVTTGVFRDPGAHYHVVVAVDMTAAVGSKVRIYVNSVVMAVTVSGLTATDDTEVNNTSIQTMGRDSFAASSYEDGYHSEVNFVDGLALEPAAFGYVCPLTGQWQPKRYTGSYGTNGFRLEFQNAADLGEDTSGNGNHWVLNGGIVAANQTVDTPTNNHAVLAMLDKTGGVISRASLRFSNGAASHLAARSTHPVLSTGEWYAEATVGITGTTNIACAFGLATSSASLSGSVAAGVYAGYASSVSARWDNGSMLPAPAVVFAAGDVLQIYRKQDKLWFGHNNIWWDGSGGTTGDPGAGLNPTFTVPLVDLFCYLECYANSLTLNTGQTAFVYAPPAGGKSLCAKNLPRPAQRAQNVFAAVVAPGSSIEATLAAARPWASYIEIFKDRSNSQSWKWRFSDDVANMLSSDSQAGKTAFTAPTAADNYVGYALRVGAAYGVFTTEVAHVNGTPTNVAHGLGTNRLMAIGKIVNTTGDWPVWHPELAANQYLLLNSTAAAAAGPKITVDATNVILAASLPSGTYRIVALAETSGCIKMGKYTGNGAADGPFVYAGGLPAIEIVKRTEAAGNNWLVLDGQRPGHNVADSTLEMDTANAETLSSANALDLVSNGSKVRGTGSGVNVSGGTYIYAALVAAPLKYANAR